MKHFLNMLYKQMNNVNFKPRTNINYRRPINMQSKHTVSNINLLLRRLISLID